ncbi:hypothetical protein SGL43_02870 [Streptomyces globisporus]|uniref:Uncharacterized protein n=1 Tax=Streptomyces globisporus TaxID=1908 RepID=A0ABM9GX66_STRGL|nr:hypothetical protein SGL43_02870 [Streptomyces globisporus]
MARAPGATTPEPGLLVCAPTDGAGPPWASATVASPGKGIEHRRLGSAP